MSEQFMGEIRIASFGFAPRGWAFCNGQILPISQNQALFSILGTQYGGDGQTTFALPNFQGRMPVHQSSGINVGAAGGEAMHVLTQNEMPRHNHPALGSTSSDTGVPSGAVFASGPSAIYAAQGTTTMAPSAVQTTGLSLPHENRAPYLVLNFIVALTGIFPSRS